MITTIRTMTEQKEVTEAYCQFDWSRLALVNTPQAEGCDITPDDGNPPPAYEVVAVADRDYWPTFHRPVSFAEVNRVFRAAHLS